MPINNYDEAISWLFEQFPSYQNIGAPAYKPGLENTLALAKIFGKPQDGLKFIHIAGSNGKGSVCSMLASIYKEAGYKTGLFTSPHLVDFRERIRINGEMISEEFVVDFCQRIQQTPLTFSPSFFEITWIMALSYFAQMQCDLCVIEVGLGGRLDSTNIIHPEVSVITSISLEHQQFLGDTEELIAVEKGGIIKENVPLVIGQKKPSTQMIFESLAKERNARLYWTTSQAMPSYFPLLGDYQQENYASVVKTIELLQTKFPASHKALENGLKNLQVNTGFYGRLQVVEENPRVIMDVSHNADGIQKTLNFVQEIVKQGKLILLYGTSSDKNLEDIFPLFPKSAKLICTEFSNSRSAKKEKLSEFCQKHQLEENIFQNPSKALELAKSLANKEDTILVFGSFFLLHDFLK